jgi:hypothetical protein
MSIGSNFSSYSALSQAKILEMEEKMKKLDDMQKQKDAIAHAEMDELKCRVSELSDNVEPQPIPLAPISGVTKSQASLMKSFPASPGSRKRHCFQQLASIAKDSRMATQPYLRSFADVAIGSRPIQGTSSQAQTRVQVQARGSAQGWD